MMKDNINRTISVAPMMDYTDCYYRYLARLLSPSILLYTEMVTAQAIKHGDAERLLYKDDSESPVALQLGGSDPDLLAQAARIGESFGYDEINLNVGCPSNRVQSGKFGVCLMLHPELVAECVEAMREAVNVPVTVKTRLGVDHHDSYSFLLKFVNTVKEAGCRSFIIHARKAWLNGLSPKQNRTIPPLDYERVYRLKRDHPELEIIINGGIADSAAIAGHLDAVDGVMIGRQACRHITWLHELECLFYTSQDSGLDYASVLRKYFDYIEPFCKAGASLQKMIKPCLSVSVGLSGAKELRRRMCEDARRGMDGLDDIRSWIGEFFT